MLQGLCSIGFAVVLGLALIKHVQDVPTMLVVAVLGNGLFRLLWISFTR